MLNYQRVKLLFPVNVPLFGAKKPMTGGLAAKHLTWGCPQQKVPEMVCDFNYPLVMTVTVRHGFSMAHIEIDSIDGAHRS